MKKFYRLFLCLVLTVLLIPASNAQQSNCIGNAGTPNPWPYPSAADAGIIPLGQIGAQPVFSISLWVNPGVTQNGVSILLDASHGGSSNWVIQAFGNNTYTWGNMSFDLTPGVWQHLLLTYNNGERKCFINGKLITTGSQVISYSGSPNLYLGNWPEGGRRFNGMVDEVYITRTILQTGEFTPEELVQQPVSETFGLWHFDEGSGGSTQNVAGNSAPLNGWYWSQRTTNDSTLISNYLPKNGLIGWWPFNGNADDLSGNNLNGSILGAVMTTDRKNVPNSSFDFTFKNAGWGTQNNEIYIPDSPLLDVTNISVSVWLFPRSYFWSGDSGNPNSTIITRYQYGYSNPNGQAWGISFNASSVSGGILGSNGIGGASATSTSPLALNEWHHLALTYNGNQIKLYIDGALAADKAYTGAMNTSGNSGISIGESNQANGFWQYTDGKIDDIGIWNRAISQAEVLALYQSSAIANTAPTALSLSNSSITSGMTAGSLVGTFSATDADSTLIYSLAAGEGDTDNSLFTITGNSLITAASLDNSGKSSFSIRVRVTDGGGLFTENKFLLEKFAAGTLVWKKVLDAPQMPKSNLEFRPYGFDRTGRKIYMLNVRENWLYTLDVDSLKFAPVSLTGYPGFDRHGDWIFNDSSNTIQFWRSGTDNVYQASINGGAITQVGSGGYNAELYGSTPIFNGATGNPALMNGYGYYTTKNSAYELVSSSWSLKRPNSTEEPYRRGSTLFPNGDYSKAYIIDGQGNPSGNQFESACSLPNGYSWATDVGKYCWLRDIWEIDLSNWTAKNILPVNSDFGFTGRFGYDYEHDTFYSFGGYVPSQVYGQAPVWYTTLRTFKPGSGSGWTDSPQSGDIPPTQIGLMSYYDELKNRFILCAPQGIWIAEIGGEDLEPKSQSITFNPLPSASYGDSSIGLTATSSSGLPVQYTSSDTTIAIISGNTLTIVGAGTATITATQPGDSTTLAATPLSQTLTVAKATLTATAADASKTYGDANPTFTVNYSGFKNNDTASVLDTAPTATTTANQTSGAGTYPITVNGGTDNNYTFVYDSGTLTVAKATLAAKADDQSRAYNTDNPPFTISYSGFKNSDAASVIDTAPVASSNAVKSSLPGTYTITVAGGSDNNYTFSYSAGTLTINKLEQTVTFTLPDQLWQDQSPYTLTATSTSGGPIVFTVVEGNATVSGNLLTINGAGTISVKAAQAGTDIYFPAETTASTTVATSYIVSGLITKPVGIPLVSGLAKLFYEDGGLAKNGEVVNGAYSISLVRPGNYILQVVPTGSADNNVFPAYYNAAVLNKDATVIVVNGNTTVSMEMPAKPSAEPKGQGEIKGKVSGGNGGGRFIVGRIADGVGLPNVPVYLLDTSDKVLKTVLTDKDGLFTFTELVAGTYKLALDVVGASLGSSSTTVNVDPAVGVLEVSAAVTTVNGQPVISLSVEVITGLSSGEVTLRAYPNPADEEVRLVWHSESDAPVQLQLTTSSGQVVQRQSHAVAADSENELAVSLRDLPQGMYLLRVEQGAVRRVLKVVRR